MTKPCHSRQIESDFIVSPSEESYVDDSDNDPNYVRQKKKTFSRKVIPSSSSSSDNTSSNASNSSDSSSSSSSDSETETRAITHPVAQPRSQEVFEIETTAVTDTARQPQTQNVVDTEYRDVTDTIAQPQSYVVNEVSNDQPNEEVKRGKKRLRRESAWKANICKVSQSKNDSLKLFQV